MADKYDITKIVKLGLDAEKSGRRAQEDAKCRCPHTKKGRVVVLPNKNGLFTCSECRKNDINLAKTVLDQAKIDEAAKTLDNVFDIIKMNLNLENENDQKLLKNIRKMQMFIRVDLKDTVESIRRNNGKKKKKNDGGGSAWGKSRMI